MHGANDSRWPRCQSLVVTIHAFIDLSKASCIRLAIRCAYFSYGSLVRCSRLVWFNCIVPFRLQGAIALANLDGIKLNVKLYNVVSPITVRKRDCERNAFVQL